VVAVLAICKHQLRLVEVVLVELLAQLIQVVVVDLKATLAVQALLFFATLVHNAAQAVP
jgi:hypothetical protein